MNMCQSTVTEREQVTAATAVELIIEFKAVLFPYASEGPKDCIEFALVLAHCLFQLSGDAGGKKFMDEVPLEGDSTSSFPDRPLNEGLVKGIHSAWNILLAARCLEFESHCRVSIPPGSSIDVGRLLLREMAQKQWNIFYEKIKPKQTPSGGMLRKMSGSLGKLTSASRRALQVKRTASVTDAMSWLRIEADTVREYIVNEITDKNHYDKRCLQEAHADWLELHRSLTSPGGLFGPDGQDEYVRWMLDTSEGPARTRRRMIKNYEFYDKYPAAYFNELGGKHRSPTSGFSNDLYRAHHPEMPSPITVDSASAECHETPQPSSDEDIESIARKLGQVSYSSQEPMGCEDKEDTSSSSPTGNSNEPLSPTAQSADILSLTTTNEQVSQNQSVLHGRILEKGDRVRYMFRIGRVTGLDAYEGILVIGKINCYLIDGLGLTCENKIKEIAQMDPEEQKFVIPTRQNEPVVEDLPIQVNKFALNKIRNIEKRRYLLQPIALELFLSNGRTYLVAFEKNERQRALQRIIQYASQARSTDPNQIMSTLTAKWENGEISNFEYLVILNTWAGRTYNDLMQYPVFPWVLADYDSNVLDFSKR